MAFDIMSCEENHVKVTNKSAQHYKQSATQNLQRAVCGINTNQASAGNWLS